MKHRHFQRRCTRMSPQSAVQQHQAAQYGNMTFAGWSLTILNNTPVPFLSTDPKGRRYPDDMPNNLKLR